MRKVGRCFMSWAKGLLDSHTYLHGFLYCSSPFWGHTSWTSVRIANVLLPFPQHPVLQTTSHDMYPIKLFVSSPPWCPCSQIQWHLLVLIFLTHTARSIWATQPHPPAWNMFWLPWYLSFLDFLLSHFPSSLPVTSSFTRQVSGPHRAPPYTLFSSKIISCLLLVEMTHFYDHHSQMYLF